MYQQFNPDGTWLIARKLEDLPDKPDAQCTYSFEGTQFMLIEVNATGVVACDVKTATYRVEPPPNGNIRFVRVKEPCIPRGQTVAQEHRRVR